ncbi:MULTISPECIES: SusC/RagA family TonB-linked outer membrane protein [Flavobacteriaceae]|uniref:SusC/RagA family TonB-linked outer membrane protein n=1 Tax=Flavobacteriaceae TaxID=49546 RepID=UPI001492007B|nr:MULTISPECIES: TonB-dependent receptor [Allomuricauda]
MRTFIFLLCTMVFGFNSSKSISQEIVHIEHDQMSSINQVFRIIKRQTDYRFLYPRDAFRNAPRVQLKKGEISVTELLKKSLSNKNFDFELSNNNTIVIKQLPKLVNDKINIEKVEQYTVQGLVTDEAGQPLPGANIVEKNTSNGTQTDFDGNFSITVSSTDAILVISYIGFLPQEITVGQQTNIQVALKEDTAALDEVVVIGYGEQKRSDISGAVSGIKQKEIARNPAANISNALVGQTTGIIATQRSGEPGKDGSNILIRGIGTTGNAEPIYVIDGIIRTGRDFSQLNPNEIESFSVLKDASSAAVFGVRGGNGVILITTKRGKAGKMQINFSSSLGIQERTRDPDLLDSYEYATLFNEANINEGNEATYSAEDLQKYQDGSSPDTHPNVDWLSVLNKSAIIKTYNIAANGGSENVQYAVSFGALDQDGIIPGDNFKRYNFRSNIDANVTKTTRLSFDVSGRDENIDATRDPEVFRWLMSAKPNLAPIKWSNGVYSSGPAYLALKENGYRRERSQVFLGRIQIEQQLPIDGLSLKGIAAYDKTIKYDKNWNFLKVPYSSTAPVNGVSVFEPIGGDAANFLEQKNSDNQSLTLEAHLNYKKTFGKSNVSGLLLYTQTKQVYNELYAKREGFKLDVDELKFGSLDGAVNDGYSLNSARQGIVGRVNWTYDDKYILEGSFRADGSEQFAPGNRWGFFPSGSAAYIISRESFLENSSIINFLKLRGSYGVLGNDRLRLNGTDQIFLYIQQYGLGDNAIFGSGTQQTINEGRLPSPNVTWETVKKLNVGFDARLFNNNISLSFDYFNDKRSDILGNRDLSVPSLLGVSLPIENLAKVDNQGIEIELGHSKQVNEDFRYSMNANFTYARNKVLFIDEAESDNQNIRRTGQPLGTQFGLIALGIFQSQEEIDNAPTHFSTTGPGDIRYADLNGPDGVPDGVIDDYDRTSLGILSTDNNPAAPEIIFGYRGNVYYKNFEFSFLLQGAASVQQYYSGEGVYPFFLGTGPAYQRNLDRWTLDNPNASEPRVLIGEGAQNNHRFSSFWAEDASYLRLKNVELAYNVPVETFGKGFVQGIRIYANANNVYTWSKIKDFDPENSQSRGWGYPQLRIWNFGIDVNF